MESIFFWTPAQRSQHRPSISNTISQTTRNAIAQRSQSAFSKRPSAALEPTSRQWWEVGSQWPEMAAAEFL